MINNTRNNEMQNNIAEHLGRGHRIIAVGDGSFHILFHIGTSA
jgi:hypothetical protein